MSGIIHQIVVSYDGTAFKGWQRQGKLPTVQLALEDAVARCWEQRCVVHGSGRTDTGVHGLAQTAHFRAPRKFDAATIVRALNHHLPPEVRVLKARFMPDTFHARFSATGKEYFYRVVNDPVFSPFEMNRAWHVPRPLDIAAMRDAARHFVGKHDFASFTSNPGYKRVSTVRELYFVRIQKSGELVTLRFRGNGFLYRMVRNLVGALVKVGLGRLTPDEVKHILQARSRQSAPNTAPACGLYLAKVFYGRNGSAVSENESA